jgi:hypothetical protein
MKVSTTKRRIIAIAIFAISLALPAGHRDGVGLDSVA